MAGPRLRSRRGELLRHLRHQRPRRPGGISADIVAGTPTEATAHLLPLSAHTRGLGSAARPPGVPAGRGRCSLAAGHLLHRWRQEKPPRPPSSGGGLLSGGDGRAVGGVPERRVPSRPAHRPQGSGHRPKLAFVFSGQGSQWIGMGQEQEPRLPRGNGALRRGDPKVRWTGYCWRSSPPTASSPGWMRSTSSSQPSSQCRGPGGTVALLGVEPTRWWDRAWVRRRPTWQAPQPTMPLTAEPAG